ncbi:MAG: hypothetical protein KGO81_03255 [Bacteroidota bacterium]|nr:hypothetical protein [Bacteroidota bacterium]
MARLSGDGFSGSLGNIVFYKVNGETYLRLKPGKGSQKRKKRKNPNTRSFGQVSTHTSPIAALLKKHISFSLGRYGYNSMRGWILKQYKAYCADTTWPLEAQGSHMCQLNKKADLRNFLFLPISVIDMGNGEIKVSIPAFSPLKSMKAPAGTRQVQLNLTVITSPFGEKTGAPLDYHQRYSFNYTNSQLAPVDMLFSVSHPDNNIAIVVASLEFIAAAGKVLEQQEWLPAAILAMGRLQ